MSKDLFYEWQPTDPEPFDIDDEWFNFKGEPESKIFCMGVEWQLWRNRVDEMKEGCYSQIKLPCRSLNSDRVVKMIERHKLSVAVSPYHDDWHMIAMASDESALRELLDR